MKNESTKNIPVMRPILPNITALKPYLEQIDVSQIYTNGGQLLHKLEARLAAHFQTSRHNVIATANGTTALSIALMSRKRERKYCLLPSWTFAASAHAVCAAGMIPYFLDVDENTQQLSVETAREAIARLGEDVGAVMLIAPYGAPVDVSIWEIFQEETGVSVILDAAAGFVTTRASKITTCLSLHATKIFPAAEGGVIITSDREAAIDMRPRLNFGFWNSREAQMLGGNAKMSEYHAAIGLAAFDGWASRRREFYKICEHYRQAVDEYDGISFQDGFGESWFNSTAVLKLDQPVGDALKAYLETRGIYTRRWWGKACHSAPAFASFPKDNLETTERLVDSVIGLPCYLGLTASEIDHIVTSVAEFVHSPLRKTA